MNILVINAGSSSLKFQVYDGDAGDPVIKGHYLDIGGTAGKPEGARKIAARGHEEITSADVGDHRGAIRDLLELLKKYNVFRREGDITAIGHRIVHGGERYSAATLISPEVRGYLESISFLAPLHNPIGLSCIDELSAALPDLPQFAIFDTAFHRTIPEAVYLYGLPLDLYAKYGIRKYGFHGTNHKYAAFRAAEITGRDIASMKIITCHLGNGQSLCAVKYGKSVDTSMGFTPLEGLPMGTRSGSFDPEIIFFLMEHGYGPGDIKTMVNKRSGLLGVSGISSDFQVIEKKARSGDENAKRASDMLINRITCLIGAYAAEMGGVDAIVFTGGIGENSAYLRKGVLDQFDYMGLQLDDASNERNAETITAPDSTIRALVIPANEELQIAREVLREVSDMKG
jgi:acetate kinase